MSDHRERTKDEGVTLESVKAEIQLKREAQQIGKVGEWFGSPENAAVYLAAALVLIIIVVLAVIAFIDAALRRDLATALAGLAIAALGYMGGRLHK